MRDTILERLRQLESEHGVCIIYAVESGSRAWGFASPNSDFDVRFIYLRPPIDYLSVFPGSDVIEPSVDGLLDFGGWDAQKAFGLLRKNNCALLEWLHSPIVYRQLSAIEPMRAMVAQAFRPVSALQHYAALARGKWRDIECTATPKIKHYCYALRAVLCSSYIIQENAPPPVPVDAMIAAVVHEPALLQTIQATIERKKRSEEKDSVDRIPLLDAFIQRSLQQAMEHRSVNSPSAPVSAYNTAFVQTLVKRWGKYVEITGE